MQDILNEKLLRMCEKSTTTVTPTFTESPLRRTADLVTKAVISVKMNLSDKDRIFQCLSVRFCGIYV